MTDPHTTHAACVAPYRELLAAVEAAGHGVYVACGTAHSAGGVRLVPSTEAPASGRWWSFSVVERERDWYLWFDRDDVFRLRAPADLIPRCLALLRAMRAAGSAPTRCASFAREFGLERTGDFRAWETAERARLRDALARAGWRELPRAECDACYDRAEALAAQPARVWDLAGHFHVAPPPADDPPHLPSIRYRDPARFAALRLDLHARVRDALRACTSRGARWAAANVQGAWFALGPHAAMTDVDLERWPVPVFSTWDPTVFLAPDARCGLRCDHVALTVTAFGEPLLAALAARPPVLFATAT